MLKLHSKMAAGAALSVALLAGCGGGGGGSSSGLPAATDISQNISALIIFMNNLIAGTSESGDPIAINDLNLVTDDTAQPSPIN